MWKTIALAVLSVLRRFVKLNGEESVLWDEFIALLRSL